VTDTTPPASVPASSPLRPAQSRLPWVKLGFVALVILSVILLIPSTPLGRYLAYDELLALVASAGAWGPAAFLALFVIGTVFIAPASIMAFAAAAVFGKFEGLLWVTIATNLGASAAFGVGRWAGRGLVASYVRQKPKPWLRRLGELIETSGLMTVLVMRMVFSPYNLMNYAASLTRLRYRDYVLGTFFGMMPVVFVWVFLGDVLGQVWREADLRPLWSWQTVAVGGVFVVCLALPLVLRKRGRL
jgi:uncharacterized membrane protein YdjX (TVP38/TMEM64 family)